MFSNSLSLFSLAVALKALPFGRKLIETFSLTVWRSTYHIILLYTGAKSVFIILSCFPFLFPSVADLTW